jgi:NAD(P)-dependent dehydrogenase (short-subunit alcohol dehydrogenase family)
VKALSQARVKTAIVDLNREVAVERAEEVRRATGTEVIGVGASVLDRGSLVDAKAEINGRLGTIQLLINGAGGNSPKATTASERLDPAAIGQAGSFFGLDLDGFRSVFDLNFIGTLLPTMVFATDMLEAKTGSVLNISSMNAFRPLTKIPAYSAAKAAINNFTEWLAVHFAEQSIRVNAIAPGFFLTNQNRFLLIDEKTGGLTPRGNKIIANTPMGRFGEVDELSSAALFLLSDAARFITGVVLPVDGGFNAYSGV